MHHTQKKTMASNEDGFILVASTVILLVLVVLGISATNTTNIEQLIAINDKGIKEDFYSQESCLASAKFQFRTWLTTPYLTNNETTAFFPQAGADIDGNGINDEIDSQCLDANGIMIGTYKVRDMDPSSTPIVGWDDLAAGDDGIAHPANNFPPLSFRDKPDPGSGYDPKNFEIRRFVITSYSPDATRNIVIQEGTYKVFNKF